MKRVIVAAFVCMIFASVSFAQQNDSDAPATKADIDRYFEVVHTREMMQQTMDALTVQMHNMLHDQLKNQPNLPADAEERLNKIMDNALRSLPLDDLISAMEPVFQKHLTKGDVAALVAFYSTPTGQKVLKQMPAMTGEAMQASSAIIQKTMAETNQRIDQEIVEIQKEGAQKGASTPPAQN
jgi:hypothetical protein